MYLRERRRGERIKRSYKRYKMEENIFLLGHQENPYKFIYNCKAVISTSLYEDPGFVLIESFFLINLLFLQIQLMVLEKCLWKKILVFFIKLMIQMILKKKLMHLKMRVIRIKSLMLKNSLKCFHYLNTTKIFLVYLNKSISSLLNL